MVEKYIVTLIRHRSLGYILIPYVVQKNESTEFFTIKDRITLPKIKHYDHLLGEPEKTIVKWIEEYNDTELLRLFSKNKKKISSSDFLRDIDDELLEKHIRPYIERRLYKCITLLTAHSIPLYDKRLSQSVFESDRITCFKKPAHTIFNFEKKDEGLHYYLTLLQDKEEMALINKEATFLTHDPCCMILKNSLYFFQDIDAKKLQPFFTKEYVKVEKKHVRKYLNSFVKNAIKNYKVKSGGFDIMEHELLPQPVIAIEKNFDENYVFVLKFKYNEKYVFFADKPTDASVDLHFDVNGFYFTRLNRKYNLEAEYIQQLTELGLEKDNTCFFAIPNAKGEISTFVNWLNTNEKELRESGFEIEQKFLDVKYYTGEIKIQFSVDDRKNDWFDLYAVVTFGEYNISFIKLRKNILNENPEYVLPNGEIAILPKEWFARYRDLLTFGKEANDELQIKKHHFPLLESSMEGLHSAKLNILVALHASKQDKIRVPDGIRATLRPYQEDGFKWMEKMRQHELNVCLADDMGLGKTLQTITLLQHTIKNTSCAQHLTTEKPVGRQLSMFSKSQEDQGPPSFTPASLVVVPRSLLHNWTNEIVKFAPHMTLFHYIGANREKDIARFNDFNIIITTYGIVRNEFELLKKYTFLYLVLDESQVIKNPESKTYHAVVELNALHRLVLTGTPLENTLTDLWSQLNFLNKGLLGNLSFFKKEFVIPIEKKNSDEQQIKLKKMISPFILRRTKKEVEKDLPNLSEQILYCDMTEDQKLFYDEEKSKIRNAIIENIENNGLEKSSIVVLQGLTKLRQLSNHPFLIDQSYEADSGKFDEIIRRLENLAAEKHKVLIFSSFVKYLDMFSTYFEEQNHSYSYLTGSTKDRESTIQQFQNGDNTLFFLISLKAGGVGLNLTAAEYVFLLDPWWNPAVENQALSRAHRIGQQNKVFVYRFISKESVEEKIITLQQKKSSLAEEFIHSNNPLKALSLEDIKELFD